MAYKYISISTIFFLLAWQQMALVKSECPVNFVTINDKCYFFSSVIPFKLSWESAREYCMNYQSATTTYDLLVLDDIDESIAIADEMTKSGHANALIGARDLGLLVSQWVWVDGTQLFLNSSLWDCFYPDTTETDHVAFLNQFNENVAGTPDVIKRFRIRDLRKEINENFICEGPQL